ncbi:MAG: hypothetical protein HOV78_11465 [Hamadaea sp.]|nr:hypothetical protein [Hamadaea sp.]
MTRSIIDTPVSDEVRAAVASGWAAYKAATAEAGAHDSLDQQVMDAVDKRVIDDVIHAFVRQGRPFSANAIRPHLPAGVRKCLISRRLIAAQNDGLIRYVGVTPSTLASTKAARVNVYAPIPGALS